MSWIPNTAASNSIYFIVNYCSVGHFELMSMEADEDEHSIEMQLPYIAKVSQPKNQS
jgi:hypothetical protein